MGDPGGVGVERLVGALGKIIRHAPRDGRRRGRPQDHGRRDELIDELVGAAANFSSPLSALLAFYIHGAAVRPAASATAFSARRPQWDFDAIGCWTDPAESATHTAWVRAVWARLEPHLLGSVYVNHIAVDDQPEKVRASFGENHARLRAIKAATTRQTCFASTPTSPPRPEVETAIGRRRVTARPGRARRSRPIRPVLIQPDPVLF